MFNGEKTALRLERAIYEKDSSISGFLRKHRMSKDVIQNMRVSTNGPTAETIMRLCRALNCSADWLLGLKE